MAQPTEPSQDSGENHGRLNGWKEIANHLGKGVRTVQRWEEEFGLPVHRLPGRKRDIVFAYASEIDAWLREHSPLLNNGESNHAVNGEPSAAPEPPTAALEPPARISLPLRMWLGAAVLALGILTTGWFTWARLTSEPARFEIKGNRITVYDQRDTEVWHRDFEENFVYVADPSSTYPPGHQSALRDLDGDGRGELLAILASEESPGNARLVCFDHRGQIKWEYVPRRAMRYGSETFAPPFGVSFFAFAETKPGGPLTIWAVSHHIPWFPAVVTKLDARGEVQGEYWHAGHIDTLAEAEIGGRRYLLVGATSNELMTATLSVLSVDNPSGSSPAVSDKFKCLNCPTGVPAHYIIFPRTELSRLLNSRPNAFEIRVRQDGRSEVGVRDGKLVGDVEPGASFAFDGGFRLVEAEVVEPYVTAHSELHLKGFLDHPLDRNKESLALRAVKYWDSTRFVARSER
jgi:hypothetical protein